MSVRYRVLLVEDSVQDASINIRALERAGLDLESERVETASQMEAALEAKPWDFILCDFHLPEFDGLAALDLYHARGLDIPFIAVSGQIGEEQAVKMIKAGAHEYVMKGNLHQLAPAVLRELQSAQERCIRQGTHATEDYLASIVQHCNSAIFGETLDGAIVSWNAGAERLYGYTPSEILGGSSSLLVPNHRPSEQTGIRECISQGQQVPAFETVHLCKNRTKLAVSLAVSAVRDARGRVVGISTIVEDISRRKEEESERLVLIQDLTAALANSLGSTSSEPRRTISPASRLQG